MRNSRPFLFATVTAALFPFAAEPPLQAAPGEVRSQLKIADGVPAVDGLDGGTLGSVDKFGTSCTVIGDLDGDGIPDLAVGAPEDDTKNGELLAGDNNGALHILFLNANGTVKSHRKIADGLNGLDNGDLANNDNFGQSCTALGDFDGDGIPDLAVGATGDDTGQSSAGALHLLFLNPDGTVKANHKIAEGLPLGGGLDGGTLAAFDRFGSSCTLIADLDGDGVPELAVGANGDNTKDGVQGDGNDNGAVHVLFLRANGTVKTHQKIADGLRGLASGTLADNDFFGTSCTVIGDLDGDGVPDLAVGADSDRTRNGDPAGGLLNGAVHVLFLNADGTVKSHHKLADGLRGLPDGTLDNINFFGKSCTATGDLDGNGVPDLAVGAFGDDTEEGVDGGGSENGALYVLFLESDGSIKTHRKIADGLNGLKGGTLATGDHFGYSCTALGDLDGDGVPEFAVGAKGDNTQNGAGGGVQAGAVYILALGDPPLRVTTAVDEFDDPSLDGSGNLSLREAIRDAETSGGFRTILFDSSLEGEVITLDGTELPIASDLLIDASELPDGITISGDDRSRVFQISLDTVVTMKSLTITRGLANTGGGILNQGGTLSLEQCTVANNRAGEGGLGGGGITNNGTMSMKQCTVSGNHAGNGRDGGDNGRDGGGILNLRTLTLQQCTVSGNKAGDASVGGFGGDGGDGGGISRFGSSAKLTISDSIVAGNRAGSGIGGGTDGRGPDIDQDEDVTAMGINFIGDNTLEDGSPSAAFPSGFPNANGDLVGTGAAPLDPLLGPLADNGGPTRTMLPLRGSPAIDPVGGSGFSPFPTDQRGEGFPRIVGGLLDIGAVEAPRYVAPVLRLTGRRTIRTTRPRVVLRGRTIDADNDVRLVRFRDSRPRGARFRNARGTTRWSANVVLRPRVNVVRVQAIDASGLRSRLLVVRVIRTVRRR